MKQPRVPKPRWKSAEQIEREIDLARNEVFFQRKKLERLDGERKVLIREGSYCAGQLLKQKDEMIAEVERRIRVLENQVLAHLKSKLGEMRTGELPGVQVIDPKTGKPVEGVER